ncbi:MAG: nicotinate phosphoribosyltransferase [Erysipelotrichaceae bacterium]|nr:nicotinate phosphoribosyltransferase [Erysipelotrichaceae bacterium]
MIQVNEKRNLTMLMDYYELTMANGYYTLGLKDQRVCFDLFFRRVPENGGYVIAAGLETIISYVKDMHFTDGDIEYLRNKKIFDEGFLEYLRNFTFTGDIDAVPEGTPVYPNTPIVTVCAPMCEAQILETMLLLSINHQSLIATKANRIVRAAGDKVVMEFGARRAHGYDAAIYGARACAIGGAKMTATSLADELFDFPATGTMAHSWVQYFGSDYEAFAAYAKVYPTNSVFLLDTFDVLESGLPAAIRVAKEIIEPMGYRLKGVRLDSGDLAYLSKKVRKRLDAAGMEDCTIVVSNSIDEYVIESLKIQGARIDSYGVGERMITSKSEPVFGGVYKLVAVENMETGEFDPRIKISENVEKIINPGKKRVYRAYDENMLSRADIIALYDEDLLKENVVDVVDPAKAWKTYAVSTKNMHELLVPIFRNGELVYDVPSLPEVVAYAKEQLNHVMEEEKRFEYPHIHYVDLSVKLQELKLRMLKEHEKR